MNPKLAYKFILSGGGTGGHIYPAIAIANTLKKNYPNAEFLFVGAADRMEMQKVPRAGYDIKNLWISGFQRNLSFKNLMLPFKLVHSLWRSFRIIKNFQPDIAIGTGGFASGPILYVSSLKGIPTLIQEQNSYPGITNKILAKHVKSICVAYDNLQRFFPSKKIKFTGNPVRQDLITSYEKRKESKKYFNLNTTKKTLLVLGGSLGAKRINELIVHHIEDFQKHNVQLIWQCGNLYFETYKLHNQLNDVHVHAFLDRMDLAYAAADIIISRAGAISISELCIVGKPVIFVPSPNVAEDHQTKNALAVVRKNAAIMIKEEDLEIDFLKQFLDLISEDKKRNILSTNMKRLALPNATQAIVDEVKILLKHK